MSTMYSELLWCDYFYLACKEMVTQHNKCKLFRFKLTCIICHLLSVSYLKKICLKNQKYHHQVNNKWTISSKPSQKSWCHYLLNVTKPLFPTLLLSLPLSLPSFLDEHLYLQWKERSTREENERLFCINEQQ